MIMTMAVIAIVVVVVIMVVMISKQQVRKTVEEYVSQQTTTGKAQHGLAHIQRAFAIAIDPRVRNKE